MRTSVLRALGLATALLMWRCGGQPPQPPPAAATTPPPATVTDDADPADEAIAPPATVRSAAMLAALLPSNATGCAPSARCIKVTSGGQPQISGTSIAQCRGEFADFIVPANTIPAGYGGPWFQPNKLEEAHTGVPSGTRPWRHVDPRQEGQRLAYVLALRNYAFASAPVHDLSPTLTSDGDYFDTSGGSVPANQRSQKWYPAPRMIYGNPSSPGTREAARGMTLERTVTVHELGGNVSSFKNYAVAYYDARGARTYARVWKTATPGVDIPDRSMMTMTSGAFVFKLLFSAAGPSTFPAGHDLLEGSIEVNILPNGGGTPVAVRLLQIDVAVRDDRAGATGWYFSTLAYDTSIAGTSPWLKMVPVGLMWGNDPAGPPLTTSWINPAAPAYAKAHLGVDGRLNGPVDNPASACLSCHGTAQAPTLANMVPPASGPCLSQRPAWFRNLSRTQAFGRFDPQGSTCEASIAGVTLTAADYSLQLAATVTRSVAGTATVNPCTFDRAAPAPAPPPPPSPGPAAAKAGAKPTVFAVTRDPKD